MYQLDDLDRGLLHALHVNGRAPFSHIAEALDVSTQTVARRYRRLRALASLRVIGLTDPQRTGESLWLARFSATPQAAQDIANSLARRSDTSWVKLASGGTEIVAVVRENNHSLLLHDTPRTTSITAVSAHYILHTYLGGPTAWSGHTTALSEDQQRLLRPPAVAGGSDQPLMAEDASLLAALGRDGRTSHADLATVTKRSPSTVARRLADLQASGAVFFDVEIDPACLGARAEALLWMSVMPARLDEVAGDPRPARRAGVRGGDDRPDQPGGARAVPDPGGAARLPDPPAGHARRDQRHGDRPGPARHQVGGPAEPAGTRRVTSARRPTQAPVAPLG